MFYARKELFIANGEEQLPLYEICDSTYKWNCHELQYRYSNIPFRILAKDIPLTIPKEDEVAYRECIRIKNNIDEFAYKGLNLFIYSKYPGTGKTSWAYKMMREYMINQIDYCRRLVMFINIPEFYIEFKINGRKKEFLDQVEVMKNIPLLTLDDIAAAEISTDFKLLLYSIVSSRLDSELSTIYTSNKNGKALKDSLGDLLYSRIKNTCRFNLEFKGTDKRGMK